MWEFWRGKLGKRRGEPRAQVTSPTERRNLQVVNFKDLNLSVDDELESEESWEPGQLGDEDPTNKGTIIHRTSTINRAIVQKNKLIIIMVGLPGRGKTFLCNKLKCYLNWLGHSTAHFNVGNYRRKQRGEAERQDANFFDAKNQQGVFARQKALDAALADMMSWLGGPGQVAIFDATNTTEERRRLLIDNFHGKNQYMFIESICNDTDVLQSNYRYKMKFSPDYEGIDTEAALADFLERIRKYEQVYEPITDRRLHYIKLIDMVTGRGHMDVNRISGYIPGKIVFFLMQICKAGMSAGQSRKIWLTRHGESEYNVLGKIGGDSLLSPRGGEYARALPDALESRLPASAQEGGVPVSVWTSTLKRTIMTANYLPYPKLRWKALDEIHAGAMDGMTYPEIAQKFPVDFEARKRDKLQYRYPAGESYLDVIQRLEPVIIEMEREREYVVVVAHQAVLRAIFGYFTATPPRDIPRLDIPLHTLIELTPRPDGTMEVTRFPVHLSTPTPRPGTGSSSDAGAPAHGHGHGHGAAAAAAGGSGGGGAGAEGKQLPGGMSPSKSPSRSIQQVISGDNLLARALGGHRRSGSGSGSGPASPAMFGLQGLWASAAAASSNGGGGAGAANAENNASLAPAGGSGSIPPRAPGGGGGGGGGVNAAATAAVAAAAAVSSAGGALEGQSVTPVCSIDAECIREAAGGGAGQTSGQTGAVAAVAAMVAATDLGSGGGGGGASGGAPQLNSGSSGVHSGGSFAFSVAPAPRGDSNGSVNDIWKGAQQQQQ